MLSYKNFHKNHSFFYSIVALLFCFFTIPQSALATSGDFDSDGKDDVFWQDAANGDTYIWLMNGATFVPSPASGLVAHVNKAWITIGAGDFDGSGRKNGLLWYNPLTGAVHIWIMGGLNITPGSGPVATVGKSWKIVDINDYNADGKSDIVWRNKTTGQLNIWFMSGTTILPGSGIVAIVDPAWQVAGSGNFDGAFGADIVWRHKTTGQVNIWLMNGTGIVSGANVATLTDANWDIVGIGDFDTSTGNDEILLRNKVSGSNRIWSINGTGTAVLLGSEVNVVAGNEWKIVSVGDYNGDGTVDFLMENAVTGVFEVYLMDSLAGGGVPRAVASHSIMPALSGFTRIVADSVNTSPFVDAGADLTIGIATAGIPLVATAADADGDPLTIQWQFMGFTSTILTKSGAPAGTATIVSATSAATMFTPTTIGLYDFNVTASDAVASTSATIRINFTNELVGVLPASLRDAPVPLNTIPVVPATAEIAGSGLNQYIPDTVPARAAAVKLGKALFWDMQVGSDGLQACATCHFHAGTDNRIANTMNRGPDGLFKFDSATADIGPNQNLTSGLFPLHLFQTPDDRFSPVTRTTDDIVGAEGVYDRLFVSLNPGTGLLNPGIGVENSTANPTFPDAAGFSVGSVNVRRVTGRNAPTVINAVFNLRNFHDGRARHHFNGANPFGNLDTTVTTLAGTPFLRTAVPFVAGSVPAPFVVTGLNRSSLASQAVGPPLSDFEMSHGGKDFPTLGKKLLDPWLVALGSQLVNSTDSVLGSVSLSPANGISDTYTALIQAAFAPEFWNSTHKYTLGAGGVPIDGGVGVPATQSEFTLMEVNFSLFFGLAIQLYESTLVADQTPFDAFLGATAPYTRLNTTTAGMQAKGAPIAANTAAMTGPEQAGMNVFFGKGLCFNCHGGPEMTLAGVNALGLVGVVGEIPEFPIEKMIGGQGTQEMSLGFATAGVTQDPGTVLLDFDPRGKRIEISKVQTPPLPPLVVYDTVFPGVASAVCTPQVLVIDLIATAVPPLIGGAAAADFSIQADCSRTFGIALAQSITIPPTFPPLGTYTVKVFNGSVGTTLASANASQNMVLVTTPILYDLGFYNLGVRPTGDDAGVGGTAPSGLTLSLAQLAKDTGVSEFTVNPGINLVTDPIGNVNGAFKVPGLRNVALTGPYFHNGGKSTLEQVLDHYDAGADFHEMNIADLAPDMVELFLTVQEKADMAAFLRALTDPRVANESAPFDHPELRYVEGQTVAGGAATDIINSIPAVGATGLSGLAVPLPAIKPFDDPAGGSILTP